MSSPSLPIKDQRAQLVPQCVSEMRYWGGFKVISSTDFSSRQADVEIHLRQRAGGIFQRQGQKPCPAQTQKD